VGSIGRGRWMKVADLSNYFSTFQKRGEVPPEAGQRITDCAFAARAAAKCRHVNNVQPITSRICGSSPPLPKTVVPRTSPHARAVLLARGDVARLATRLPYHATPRRSQHWR